MNLYRIRPVVLRDLDDIEELATLAQAGITTLPDDREYLVNRILQSQKSFTKTVVTPGDEFYFFALEDINAQKVIGVCSILAKVGMSDPFYSFEIERKRKFSKMLNREREVKVLTLKAAQNGPSEIGTLFLHPDYRRKGVGRLLSLSRFLFVATHRDRFADEIVAELRGVSTPESISPFWEKVVKPFFNLEFVEADRLSAKDKSFIADLMPEMPIYIDLIDPAAKAVIGKPHVNSKAALSMLLQEGFQFTNGIDIFDGGPKVLAKVKRIRTIVQSQTAPLTKILSESELPIFSEQQSWHVISTGRLQEFKATFGSIHPDHSRNGMSLALSISQALNASLGDEVIFAPLYASQKLVQRSRELLQATFLTQLFAHRDIKNPVPTQKPIPKRSSKLFLTRFSQWFKSVYQFSRHHHQG